MAGTVRDREYLVALRNFLTPHLRRTPKMRRVYFDLVSHLHRWVSEPTNAAVRADEKVTNWCWCHGSTNGGISVLPPTDRPGNQQAQKPGANHKLSDRNTTPENSLQRTEKLLASANRIRKRRVNATLVLNHSTSISGPYSQTADFRTTGVNTSFDGGAHEQRGTRV